MDQFNTSSGLKGSWLNQVSKPTEHYQITNSSLSARMDRYWLSGSQWKGQREPPHPLGITQSSPKEAKNI